MVVFEGATLEIKNHVVTITSGLTHKPLHVKDLREIHNRTELIIYLSFLIIRKWFTHKMRVSIEREVELMLSEF